MDEVVIDDEGVAYTPPGGVPRRVSWADLIAVEVVTTDEGPIREDVFWVLHGSQSDLTIPQSAPGVADLVVQLQQLPGFNNYALIAAMGSTSNNRFPCWERNETEPDASDPSG